MALADYFDVYEQLEEELGTTVALELYLENEMPIVHESPVWAKEDILAWVINGRVEAYAMNLLEDAFPGIQQISA